jgi:hypothetical protein
MGSLKSFPICTKRANILVREQNDITFIEHHVITPMGFENCEQCSMGKVASNARML